ncbi:MAG TPA: hypothetical protein VK619_18695 [Pyrinomonadaceae bacterium]|nr:hypothetical protein [Pyrinomonadaceae bacterium]
MLRGGAWVVDASGCRSASRFGYAPGERYLFNGFRVVPSTRTQSEPQSLVFTLLESQMRLYNGSGDYPLLSC